MLYLHLSCDMVLITCDYFFHEDSPFCLTRAITMTLVAPFHPAAARGPSLAEVVAQVAQVVAQVIGVCSRSE